jgi:hypothetical protein
MLDILAQQIQKLALLSYEGQYILTIPTIITLNESGVKLIYVIPCSV